MDKHSATGRSPIRERDPMKLCQGTFSSYKEAWDPKNCKESLNATGLYEAGGNATWVDPETNGDDDSNGPSWQWVYAYSEQGFQSITYNNSKESRIRFPIPLETYWETYNPTSDGWPQSLKLLAAHGHLWAWYVAVFRAMTDGDTQRVLALYECALTVTITTRSDVRPDFLAKEMLLYSERVREDAKTLVINFITFSDKIQLITGGKHDLTALQKMKVQFGGGIVNATMLKVTHSVVQHMDVDCRKLVAEIDRRFGRDVLSASYNKMRFLIQGCSHKSRSIEKLLPWCLETMLVTLMRKDAMPSDFTVTQFQKGKDGSPSWVSQAIASLAVVEHMQSILDNIGHVDQALADNIRKEVFDKMNTPMKLHE